MCTGKAMINDFYFLLSTFYPGMNIMNIEHFLLSTRVSLLTYFVFFLLSTRNCELRIDRIDRAGVLVSPRGAFLLGTRGS